MVRWLKIEGSVNSPYYWIYCILFLLPIPWMSQRSSPVPDNIAFRNINPRLAWDTSYKLCNHCRMCLSCSSPTNQEAWSDWLQVPSTQDVLTKLFGQGCLRPPAGPAGIREGTRPKAKGGGLKAVTHLSSNNQYSDACRAPTREESLVSKMDAGLCPGAAGVTLVREWFTSNLPKRNKRKQVLWRESFGDARFEDGEACWILWLLRRKEQDWPGRYTRLPDGDRDTLQLPCYFSPGGLGCSGAEHGKLDRGICPWPDSCSLIWRIYQGTRELKA